MTKNKEILCEIYSELEGAYYKIYADGTYWGEHWPDDIELSLWKADEKGVSVNHINEEAEGSWVLLTGEGDRPFAKEILNAIADKALLED